ncbi:MAG: tRNA (adenosine(37)-N6)-dimethylallyltransferase MiaA [Phycisphaerae bacterium]|nr:tRNA (adenosine(37)-N6)-dimethylallyltransferase MiaA [Phycisphaerae bacterium]
MGGPTLSTNDRSDNPSSLRRSVAPSLPANPFPLIVGPTAGGKTSLSVRTALAFAEATGAPSEIVSADAFLVYRGMDIGTAKPTADERCRVPHHLIDIRDPSEAYTVKQWLADAESAIADIRARGATPVVVGGTHLYAKALLEGLFEGPDPDPALRAELESLGLPQLRAELERVDPAAAQRIHANDQRRTIRALEVYRSTGTPISELQRQWDAGAVRPDCRLVILDWPTESINSRINARVRAMIDEGLVEETRQLWETGALGEQAREALGYKQLIESFEGRRSLDDAIEQIKIQTRRFAKNQRTWLRRLATTPGAITIRHDAHDPAPKRIVEACVAG